MDHFLLVQQPNDPTTWVLIGGGAFVLLYLAILRPMMRGKKGAVEPPSARAGGLSQQRAVERDMQTLLVEYEQMIRNMTAGLDTRAAKLELLIKEADEKLALLKAAIPAGGSDAGQPPARPTSPTPQPPPPTGPDPRHLEIYNLTDQGMSAKEVARKLGRPNGEIELILALRSSRE